MQKMEINIKLDPVTDGAVIKETHVERTDKGALVIATNGRSRIVYEDEALEIIEKMDKCGRGAFLRNTPYFILFNGSKVIRAGEGRYFIGSVIIFKYDGKGNPGLISVDEMDRAAAEFESRLVTLIYDGQEFSAYEID
ncbi:MAG: hypothetical protein K6B44_00025 [Lachnospiraceae bacterium]|nr:hypothetical protein [Lachnospiraceae bacterium]